jgi:hypothetical protein
MQDNSLQKRLENVVDFVEYEGTTSITWPWR